MGECAMAEDNALHVKAEADEELAYREYDDDGEDDYMKSKQWMGGMLQCLAVVTKFCGSAQIRRHLDDWEIDIDSIKDMVYLGAGAQGVVFGGILNGEMVAVKKLRDKTETDIKHLRKLNHVNIVSCLGVCTAEPNFGIVMEYCQYGPLFDFLHSGACIATNQILKWAKEISHGMTYLHNNKIIHRDLKSPNILISDNLVVKVSDFGTSREWSDVSTCMSFTGTVAWMAPEVIRHEPCSERVDVWSYGVVLWELLTQEIPYKSMETHAIMWGVGTDTMSLPIPTTCPSGLQVLLNQCWSRIPKNRPPFKIITAHLEIAGHELNAIRPDCFTQTQAIWREEIQSNMQTLMSRNQENDFLEVNTQRKEELHLARITRNVYEQQLKRANELYMEVCAVRLQLEQRENELTKRENAAIPSCRCNRKKIFQRQASSSSDGLKAPEMVAPVDLENDDNPRRRKKNVAGKAKVAQLIVHYDESRESVGKAVTVEVADCLNTPCECDRDTAQNNNTDTVVEKKTLVVEDNGNVLVKETLDFDNASMCNYIPNLAQV